MSKERPYIISQDVGALMKRWSRESGYQVPNQKYFDSMSRDLMSVLSGYFESTKMLSYEQLGREINRLIKKSSLPVISLDRAYVKSDSKNVVGFLDVNRAVDENLNNIGVKTRPGFPSVKRQITTIIGSLSNKKEVVIADDVLFGGDTLARVAEMLLQQGLVLKKVITGIAIQEGIDKLASQGIEVESAYIYDEVLDEICERDFVGGSPMSGRTVITKSGKAYGAPYFYPFGKPEQWASIPSDKAEEFSLFCLTQTLIMWEKIERESRSSIPTQAIPKPIFGLKKDRSISKSLRNIK